MFIELLNKNTTPLTFTILWLDGKQRRRRIRLDFCSTIYLFHIFHICVLLFHPIMSIYTHTHSCRYDAFITMNISSFLTLFFTIDNDLNRYEVMLSIRDRRAITKMSRRKTMTYCWTDCLTTLFAGQEKWRIQITWE